MSGVDRRQVEEVFQEVLDAPRHRRSGLVRERCAHDSTLRHEVERLVRAHDDAEGAFLEEPAIVSASTSLSALREVTPALAVPHRVGPYEIIRVLGEGGMGVVYEARQQNPNRTVALKVIRPGQGTAGMIKRFQREADVLGHLHHPGIAYIYEAGSGRVEGAGWSITQPYLAMELIRGEPLTTYSASRSLAMRDRLELVARVADAVQHAHEHGVIHRDLKPTNILVDAAGQPKILDFGVARLTESDIQTVTVQTDAGQIIGTLDYMSPEQVTGETRSLDARSDIYSLGVILYELLSGKLPHDLKGRPVPEAVRIIREEEPSRLSSRGATGVDGMGTSTRVDRDIETIASKAMEKDRSRRYASAAEFAADIRRHLHDEPIVARPASTFYQLRKFAKRNRTLVWGVVATFLALLGGLIGVALVAQRAVRERARAERQAYRTSMAAALSAVQSTDGQTALRYLNEAPERLRSWEWSLVRRMADPSVGEVLVPWEGAWQVFVAGEHRVAFRADVASKSLEFASIDTRTRFPAIPVDDPEDTFVRPLPDGRRVLLGIGRSRTLEAYELASGKLLWRLPEAYAKWGVGIDRLGRRLAVATDFDRKVHVIDAERGVIVQTLEANSNVPVPCFSPDGSLLAAGDRVYQLDPVRELWRTNGDFQSFSEDGTRAVVIRTVEGGFRATLADARTGEVQGAFPIANTYSWSNPGVIFRADGEVLFELSSYGQLQARDARTLDVLSSALVRPDAGLALTASALALSDQGRSVAVNFGHNQAVRMYDGEGIGVSWSFPSWNVPSYDAHIAPDASLMARCDWGTVSLSEPRTGRVLWRRANGIVHHRAVRLSPDLTRVAADWGLGELCVLNARDGSTLARIKPDAELGNVVTLRWVSDTTLCAGFDSGRVVIVDTTSNSPPRVLRGLTSAVTALATDPKGGWVLAGSDGSGSVRPDARMGTSLTPASEFRVWNASDGQLIFVSSMKGGVLAAASTSEGSHVALGTVGGVDVWDARFWRRKTSLRAGTSHVRAVGWDRQEQRVWGASTDAKVLLWDYPAKEDQELVSFNVAGPVLDVAFVPDGSGVVLGTARQTINWDLRHAQAELVRERTQWARAASVVRAAASTSLRVNDLDDQIRQTPGLSDRDRDSAIELARALNVYAPQLNGTAWGRVVEPGRPIAEYERAVEEASAAAEVAVDDWAVLNTLGLAQYRARRYEEAVHTLERCERLASERTGKGQSSNGAILAMAHLQLGNMQEARAWLQRSRSMLASEPNASRDSSRFLVQEATALIETPDPRPREVDPNR